MAQTPATKRQTGELIDYTPGGAVTAGDVIVLGTALVGVVQRSVAASVKTTLDIHGAYNMPKDSSDVAIGVALYWDADGSPVGGTALSGAVTTTSTGNPFAGWALEAAGTGVGDVDVDLRSADSTTISGDLTRTPVATVAVGGTAIGNANAVSTGFTLVTGADDTAAIKLPAAAEGKVCIVKNGVSNKILKVFPAVNDQINGTTANSVYNQTNGAFRMYVAFNAVSWFTDPEVVA